MTPLMDQMARQLCPFNGQLNDQFDDQLDDQFGDELWDHTWSPLRDQLISLHLAL